MYLSYRIQPNAGRCQSMLKSKCRMIHLRELLPLQVACKVSWSIVALRHTSYTEGAILCLSFMGVPFPPLQYPKDL